MDVRGGLLRRDPALCAAHLSRVPKRLLARAGAHLRLDPPKLQEPRLLGPPRDGVAVGHYRERSLRGLQDDHGRQSIEHPGVELPPRRVPRGAPRDRSARWRGGRLFFSGAPSRSPRCCPLAGVRNPYPSNFALRRLSTKLAKIFSCLSHMGDARNPNYKI